MTASKTTAEVFGSYQLRHDHGARAMSWPLILIVSVICSFSFASTAEADTVRDEFDAIAFNGNNGSDNWTGDWIEFGDGIELNSGATDNIVGGTAAGSGNLIAFSQRHGINVTGGTRNSLLGNRIHSNVLLGIDLGNNGITANDAGDGDSGANDQLNFPVITSATESGGTLRIYFDLDVPVGDYRIEFFTNPAGADPAFLYQPGTIQVDNSVALCATATCSVAEELAIFTATAAAVFQTDLINGDVASYSGASLSIDAGDQNVANPQLDINATAVWALMFSVKMP